MKKKRNNRIDIKVGVSGTVRDPIPKFTPISGTGTHNRAPQTSVPIDIALDRTTDYAKAMSRRVERLSQIDINHLINYCFGRCGVNEPMLSGL